ncbi:MAG: thiamine pyrophosphate-dependent enzyme [Acidobacteria bacterium]|nr:thiamine pyrophosphate-dependent enzyme [Acidobacteriota bacterium]
MTTQTTTQPDESVGLTKKSILRDYRLAYESRQVSLLGRREVLTGKAKFGIFGDGKEVAQVALARAFRAGDVRAGYYRDQTLMFALGLSSMAEFFSQLYADPNPLHETASAGRQMTAHFATRFLEADGSWRNLSQLFNSSADLSPTGSQMPRLVGLAQASKLYRALEGLPDAARFSDHGNEIAWGTIGNASCAEGLFWEAINAVGVLQVPMLLSIWDDDYGISVPNELQVTKGDLSAILSGFARRPGEEGGYDMHRVRGWDYPALCATYARAEESVRRSHVPAIVHVIEMTQPQGHSTSGSHERYKSSERLAWEGEFDCLVQMRVWMQEEGVATESEIEELEAAALEDVRSQQRLAWERYQLPIDAERLVLTGLLESLAEEAVAADELRSAAERLTRLPNPNRRQLVAAAQDAVVATAGHQGPARARLVVWKNDQQERLRGLFSTHVHNESGASALDVAPVAPRYADGAPELRGFELLNAGFDAAFERYPNLLAFGQDVGQLGDVNQGLAGLQAKYGELRIADTGIREATIIGQAIGLALRGFRPIAEIQYLDYLLYALQIISDDLATLHWRSAGGQKAPVIIRTRGHRLEGVWHSGSPMAGILNLVRGLHICVPRDMTRAVGFYNTLLQGDDPALVIEVLNGYRLRAPLPENLADFTVALGAPEILRQGSHVTVVTYGALCRIGLDACELLSRVGVDCELIDVQTLLPFDRPGVIVESLQKTNRLVLMDEDVPGGATAYMLQQVLIEQAGFDWLDAEPVTITAREHRPAYGSDGDYASKPTREEIFTAIYALMHRADPAAFPDLETS